MLALRLTDSSGFLGLLESEGWTIVFVVKIIVLDEVALGLWQASYGYGHSIFSLVCIRTRGALGSSRYLGGKHRFYATSRCR